jgi:hypothetical protein
MSESPQGGAPPLPPKPAGYPKWAIFGCIGCVVVAVLAVVFVFGGCLLTGAMVDKTINEAKTQALAKETRTFLSRIEAADLAAARTQLAHELAAELTDEKLKALVAKDPDHYKIADASFDRVVSRGPMIAMLPETLNGTLRTKGGATLYCRFVYVKEIVSGGGPAEPEPGPPPSPTEPGGDPPPSERMRFEWRIQSFTIQVDPIPE